MNGMKFNCSGMGRRDFLQVGLGGLAGLGFSDLLRAREGNQNKSAKPPNCILVWLDGGPSHYESFDPKPEAPLVYKSEFGDIRTSVPGVRFSEHLPLLAKQMHKFNLIRSTYVDAPDHAEAIHMTLTGWKLVGANVTTKDVNRVHPAMGAVVAKVILLLLVVALFEEPSLPARSS